MRLFVDQSQRAVRVQWDSAICRSVYVPVDTYSVELLKDDNQSWQYVDTTRPSSSQDAVVCDYRLDDLEPGTYVFRITPFNHVGSGPPALSSAAKLD